MILDFPKAKEIALRRKRKRGLGRRLFDYDRNKMHSLWAASQAKYGLHLVPVHSVRHTGPSNDVWTKYRTLEQIQKRGRWRMPASVRRYAKEHTLQFARANTPTALLERGAKIWASFGKR